MTADLQLIPRLDSSILVDNTCINFLKIDNKMLTYKIVNSFLQGLLFVYVQKILIFQYCSLRCSETSSPNFFTVAVFFLPIVGPCNKLRFLHPPENKTNRCQIWNLWSGPF